MRTLKKAITNEKVIQGIVRDLKLEKEEQILYRNRRNKLSIRITGLSKNVENEILDTKKQTKEQLKNFVEKLLRENTDIDLSKYEIIITKGSVVITLQERKTVEQILKEILEIFKKLNEEGIKSESDAVNITQN